MKASLTCVFLATLAISTDEADFELFVTWEAELATDFCENCDDSSASSARTPLELSVSSVFDLLPTVALVTGTIL